jgi:hypothetical protein
MTQITTVDDLINDENFNINDYEGYIYITTILDTGRKYIGKKNFFHNTNVKLGKKELANLPVTRGKKPAKKLIIKESDWKTYYGSAQEIKDSIKQYPKEHITRVVLRLCKTKKELTYYECKYLFQYGVLEPGNNYINDNILGKFYSKDLGDPENFS